MPRKFLAFLITVLIIIFIALTGVSITYILRVTGIDSNLRQIVERKEVVSYATVSTIVSSPVADLDKIPDKIVPKDARTSTLTSDVLKVSFDFQNKKNGYSVVTERSGNKISINSTDKSGDKAQFLELFTKKPDETLESAIKRVFLDGVPSTFCNFKGIDIEYSFFESDYVFGSIEAGVNVKSEQCPTPYTNNPLTGKRFFIYNPKILDRFGFVYIGNEFIAGSSTDNQWFETIKLLE